MKKLLFLLFLVGCGDGYTVYERTISLNINKVVETTVNENVYKTVWVCEQQKPLFQFDSIIANCDTKEECNSVCDKMRRRLEGIKDQ
jgi:hypothetical protein